MRDIFSVSFKNSVEGGEEKHNKNNKRKVIIRKCEMDDDWE